MKQREEDGAFVKWVRVRRSELGPLEPGEIDGPVWVISSVTKTRKEAYDDGGKWNA